MAINLQFGWDIKLVLLLYLKVNGANSHLPAIPFLVLDKA